MALPKLENPTYETELPSTNEKIKFRPFLIKEQKLYEKVKVLKVSVQ